MNLMRFQRYDLLVILACIGLLSSFAWYAYKGPRGYEYRASLERKIETLAADNAKLVDEKEALERKVASDARPNMWTVTCSRNWPAPSLIWHCQTSWSSSFRN